MNREVLKDIFVSRGDYYANDALQYICSKIYGYSISKTIDLINLTSDEKLNNEEQIEYHKQSEALENMINLFNSIVSLGKDDALKFIRNNYEQFIGEKYKE